MDLEEMSRQRYFGQKSKWLTLRLLRLRTITIDFVRSKKVEEDRARARQNVVFETGYFIGNLGRDHIVILADDGIEMPSDLSGVVRTNTGNWQFELLK